MSWASPATWHSDAAPSSIVHCRMHFGYNNRTHVERMARRVSDPRSRWYRRYPSVEKFTARFAPSQAYFAQLTQFLTTEGFNVAYEAVNRKYIAFDGTVAQFGRTFHTSFGMYSVRGLVVRSPKSEPSIPAHLFQGHEIQLLGLDQGWHVDLATRKPRPRVKGSPSVAQKANAARVAFQDCQWSSASSYSYDPKLQGCGYRPQQIRSAYGAPPNLDGSGQTVAIIDAFSSPYMQSDLDRYSSAFQLPSTKIRFAFPPFNYSAPANKPPRNNYGWQGEESLDLEAVHGIAPKATLIYIGATSDDSYDLLSALNYVLEYKVANIVSNSYGRTLYGTQGINDPVEVQATEDILLQAVVLGVGVYTSSGDSGDESTDMYNGYTKTPDYFAASPNAIAVGGTTLAFNNKGGRVAEFGWGTNNCLIPMECTFLYGSGGGVANTFATPSYQKGNQEASSILTAQGFSSGRVVPDVAAVGDPYTGLIVGSTTSTADSSASMRAGFHFYVIGIPRIECGIVSATSLPTCARKPSGTSLACPIFAALMALKQQQRGKVYGFANPLFYSNPQVFNDIKNVNPFIISPDSSGFIYAGSDQSLVASQGYDNVTGLGTPGSKFWTVL